MSRWTKVDRFRLPTGYGTEWHREWPDGSMADVAALSMGRSSTTGRMMRTRGTYREYVWTFKVPGRFTWAPIIFRGNAEQTLKKAQAAAERAHRDWHDGRMRVTVSNR